MLLSKITLQMTLIYFLLLQRRNTCSLTSAESRQKSKGQNQVTDISALLTLNGKFTILNIFVKNSYFEEWTQKLLWLVFTVLHTDLFHLSFCSLKFVCWEFITIITNVLWIDPSVNFKGLTWANKARWPALALTAILDMWWGDKPARWSENVEVFSSFIIFFFFELTKKKLDTEQIQNIIRLFLTTSQSWASNILK